MDTEIIVATARTPDATAVSANVVLDERQMNALFLDLVSYFLLQFCHQGAPRRAGGGLSGIRRVPVLQHASLEEERTRDLRTVPELF